MTVTGVNGECLTFTQRVTQADLDAGQIRIPICVKPQIPFPAEPEVLPVDLLGKRLEIQWNPRLGPDKERSGVLRFGKSQLANLVAVDEVLRIRFSGGVYFLGERGSKRRIGEWANRHRQELTTMLREASPSLADFCDQEPTWLSPLGHPEWEATPVTEPYGEFKANFWIAAKLPGQQPNPGFWPDQGPNWDGLAALTGPAGSAGVLLVEAKSHTSEPRSDCKAKGPGRTKIEAALNATRVFVGSDAPLERWLGGYYQYANRLAFLYYLRARANVPAWLALVNFVGDSWEGSNADFPSDAEGWGPPAQKIRDHLGLPECHALSPYLIHVYPPAAGPG